MTNPEKDKFLHPSSFGQGTFLGDDPSILDLSLEDQLIIDAHRHACPRPKMVVQFYGQEWKQEFLKIHPTVPVSEQDIINQGIEKTIRRYRECNFVFGVIVEHIKNKGEQKSGLLKALTSSTKRLPGEPVGVFEDGHVPESHKYEKSPLSTLVGYALPRVFIELAGRENERTWDRYDQAFNLLDKSIKDSNTPEELLACLAEEIYSVEIEKKIEATNEIKNVGDKFQFLVDPTDEEVFDKQGKKALKAILSHVLEPGILMEENNVTEYRKIGLALKKHAPKLWDFYLSLSDQEKKEAGIFQNLDISAVEKLDQSMSPPPLELALQAGAVEVFGLELTVHSNSLWTVPHENQIASTTQTRFVEWGREILQSKINEIFPLDTRLVHTEADFTGEIMNDRNVVVKPAGVKVGNTSMTLEFTLSQDDQVCSTFIELCKSLWNKLKREKHKREQFLLRYELIYRTYFLQILRQKNPLLVCNKMDLFPFLSHCNYLNFNPASLFYQVSNFN